MVWSLTKTLSLLERVIPSIAKTAFAPAFVNVAPTPDDPLLYVALRFAVVPTTTESLTSNPVLVLSTYVLIANAVASVVCVPATLFKSVSIAVKPDNIFDNLTDKQILD